MRGLGHAGRSWGLRNTVTGQPWRERAACREHPDLPWTADAAPRYDDAALMTAICAACPVWRDCAEHVLSAKKQGGFWAGVWIPWVTMYEAGATRLTQRDRARATLRNRLATARPLTDDEQL